MLDTGAMVRQLLLTTLLIAPAVAADGTVSDCVEVPADPRPDCIEAVVLARFIEYRPLPLPDAGEDVIVMSWTWDVDIDVREVYLGEIPRGRLTIGATLHTEFNSELHQPVLFLTRKFGRWYLARIEFAARGPDGLVVPMFDEPQAAELSPEGWLPKDYASWLRPVRYRWRDVKAFGRRFEDDEGEFDRAWVSVGESRVTALRGFKVADIPAMLAERRSLECAGETPP
jgi:hypothetical protein